MTDNKQPPYPLFKSILAKKFIIYIVLFSSIITLLGTSLQLYLDYSKDKSLIQSTLDNIGATHVHSIINSLWVADRELINVQLQEILSLPDVRYVEISSDAKEKISLGIRKSTLILSKEYPLRYSFRKQEVNLGKLHIEASLEKTLQRLGSRVFLILLTQGIKTFLVSLFIVFVFYSLIGRHLIRMANYSEKLDLEHLHNPLTLDRSVPKNIPKDELETLVFSINKMRSNLQNGITAIKKSESALLESEKRLRNLFANLPFPIMVHSEDGHVLMINKTWSEITGYSHTEIPTIADWTEKAYGDKKKAITEKILPLYTIDKQVNEGEFAIRTNSGGTVIWDFSSAPLGELPDGKKLVVSIANDVTERKIAEENKKEMEKRLQQAQKMEAIGTLAGGIAHDFNNILAIILGYVQLAIDDTPSETQHKEDLEKVLIAAKRAKNLVQQILAFSRQSQVERFPLQLQPLVKEALKMLRSSIPTTISITENIDPKSSLVLADPTQIHQILMNLCTNAYHAMGDGGGELSITLKNVLTSSPPGEYVDLSVSDTGNGIGPDIIEKIFNPYFTTKELGKGTGMGLAIIHGIMEEYGGSITVESQLGKGSTFHAYFPVVQEEALPEIINKEDIPRGDERILFVDDEEMLAEMGQVMLERLGYHVTVRHNGSEALETFQNNPDEFDLVITDQTMPELTGSDLARRLLQIRPDVPIILCTGFSNTIDEDSAQVLGIKEFALKPLEKSSLSKLIRKVLDE